MLIVKVTSIDTGRTGTYMEITVNFPEDGSKATAEDIVYSSVFSELQEADSEPTIDTNEPEIPVVSEEVSEPEPEHTTSSSHTETEPIEPDPGISVN